MNLIMGGRMETILLIVSIGLMNILCFFIGARVGQKVVNKEEIKLPNVNPIQAYREIETKKEIEKADEQYKKDLEAINNYNGYI